MLFEILSVGRPTRWPGILHGSNGPRRLGEVAGRVLRASPSRNEAAASKAARLCPSDANWHRAPALPTSFHGTLSRCFSVPPLNLCTAFRL